MVHIRLLGLLLTSSVPVLGLGSVATVHLKELARSSPLIVVGRVEWIEFRQGLRIARVHTEQLVKGSAPGVIGVLAQPTWRCDISDAKPGERSILFLTHLPKGTKIELWQGFSEHVEA